MSKGFFVIAAVIAVAFVGISNAGPVNIDFESGGLTGLNLITPPDSSISVVSQHEDTNPSATGTTQWNASQGDSFAVLETGHAGFHTAINFEVTVNQGDVLTFDYFWDSGDKWEVSSSYPHNDFASVFIARGDRLVMESVMTDPQDFWGTPWTQASYSFNDSGTYSIWFTVTNVGDGNLDSYLGIDNIVVTPEPATIALLAIGGLMLRKRKA